MVNMEDEDDSDKSREEIPCANVKDARLALDILNTVVFDFNDLRVFRKYLNLISLGQNVNKKSNLILTVNISLIKTYCVCHMTIN